VLFFHQRERERERERERKEVKKFRDMWVFKIFNFAAKKVGVAFVEYSGAKEYLETRTQHAPHGHFSALLKTDCNPTSMPRREYQSSRVCVPSGGPPEGILDVAEYIACVELFSFSLFSYFIP
jgi:hypothetical protein